ncbi:MAG: dTDP-4-dehydrorhamnose 3,5-epimerase [Bacteroidota bacterium]
MNAKAVAIEGLWVFEPRLFEDHRGYFFESYHEKRFSELTGQQAPTFVQDNQSRSQRGVMRGLHFQVAPKAQAKLIRVLSGEVFDVAVDLRPNSPTYGQWHGELLSAENRLQFFIPKGFAHGFVVLSEAAEIAYKCDDFYAPDFERSLHFADPKIGIDWKLPHTDLIISEKDADAPRLNDLESFAF